MQNEVAERLTALYKTLISELGASDLAFISAVSKGVNKVREWYEFILSELFADSMEDAGLYNYSKLLGVDLSLSKEDKREAIISALKVREDDYTHGELETALKNIDDILHMYTQSYLMKISGFTISNIEYLPKITKLIDLYSMPGVITIFSHDGLTFADWDELDKTFKELDDLNCPFSMIDTI